MDRKPFVVAFLLPLFLLAACASSTGTVTPEVIPSPTVSPTIEPTATSQPSATPLSDEQQSLPTQTALPATPQVTGEVTLEIVGQAGGALTAMAVAGKAAYLGLGPRLVVLDVSNPSAPAVVGQSELLPSVARSIAVAGDQVYWLSADGRLLILDVSNPADPRQVAEIPVSPAAQILSLQDSLAYLIGEACVQDVCKGRLGIVDFSDPVHPQEVGFWEMPGPVAGMRIAGKLAYIAHQAGLLVLDVSDPAQPQEVGSLASKYVSSAAFSQNHAYLFGEGLQVIDLSEPANPRQVGSWKPEPGVYNVNVAATDGEKVYGFETFGEFGFCASSLYVIDVSNPVEPRQVGKVEEALVVECAQAARVDGGRLYVAGWNGLSIVDVSGQPRLLGAFKTLSLGSFVGLAISDQYVYWGNDLMPESLYVFDVHDPAQPQAYGPFPPSWTSGLIYAKGYLYAPVWEAGVSVLDVSNPTQPRIVASVTTEDLRGASGNAAFADPYLYVTLGEQGLQVVDVSHPARPALMGRYSIAKSGTSTGGLVVSGAYAYLIEQSYEENANIGQLEILDISDPANPQPVGSVEITDRFSSARVAIAEGYAYLALALCSNDTCSGSLKVIDVSDPVKPHLVGALDLAGGALDAAISGQYALVAAGQGGVWVVNISNPAQPYPAGYLDTPGYASRLMLAGEVIYVADGGGGYLAGGGGGLLVLRFNQH